MSIIILLELKQLLGFFGIRTIAYNLTIRTVSELGTGFSSRLGSGLGLGLGDEFIVL